MAAVAAVNVSPVWRRGRPDAAERFLQPGHGVWASALLLAALELGIFDELARGPRSAVQLQRRLELDPKHAADLLDALLGLGWLERDGDDPQAVYLNTREATLALDRRSSAYVGAALQAWQAPLREASISIADLLLGHACAWAPRADPSLREGLAQLHGQALAAALDLPAVTAWLDIEGGAGRLAAALALANPGLRGTVLERAGDVERARKHLAACNLTGRINVAIGAEATANESWPPCELLTCHAVLLPGGAARREQLLACAQAALMPRGLLVVVDHLLDPPRRQSTTALTLALLRRAAGDDVVPTDFAGWAEAAARAGFGTVETQPLVDGASALLLRR